MVTMLVEKVKKDKASALDERHLAALLEILRKIAEVAEQEREESEEGSADGSAS